MDKAKINLGIIFTLALIAILISVIVIAKPNTDRIPVTNVKAKEPVPVVIPAHAVQLADNVFDLGTARDVDGRLVQGVMFVHRKENAKPPWAGSGKDKGGSSTCFTLMAKGAKWKATEQYVLDTTNIDSMTDAFVSSSIETSLNTWDSEVAFDIFGTRDTLSAVDGADENNPDGKNEVLFAPIDSPGAIAVTIVWGIFAGKPSNRELVEWDMVFDDSDFDFGDADVNSSLMDLQNIATHEDGHSLGLTHPPDECTEETMFRFASNGETKKRDLNAGDVAGVNELYA